MFSLFKRFIFPKWNFQEFNLVFLQKIHIHKHGDLHIPVISWLNMLGNDILIVLFQGLCWNPIYFWRQGALLNICLGPTQLFYSISISISTSIKMIQTWWSSSLRLDELKCLRHLASRSYTYRLLLHHHNHCHQCHKNQQEYQN